MDDKEMEKQVHNLELVLSSLKLIHRAMNTDDTIINPIDLESTLEMSILYLDKTVENLYVISEKRNLSSYDY